MGQDIDIPGCLRVTAGWAGHPMLSCKKVPDSGLVQSLAKTCQDRMWGEGQKWLCPGVKGKMISVPETNKRMKSEREDSLAEGKDEVSWL